MKEVWKGLIYQNKDYSQRLEISNNGRLRGKSTGHIYKWCLNKSTGYLQVCISLGSRKNKKVFKMHRCVAENFVKRIDGKEIINHIDGIKTNNAPENLEWCTCLENSRHAVENGLINPVVGEDSSISKLKEKDVIFILKNCIPRDREFGFRALGRLFNVNKTAIESVYYRKTWKHVSF